LKRSRRFDGFTNFEWEGQDIAAARFVTDDVFETEEVGWTTSRWSGEEWYALGIGLVYYKRNISDQMVLEFVLTEKIKNERADTSSQK
jgi:hypothetical protein